MADNHNHCAHEHHEDDHDHDHDHDHGTSDSQPNNLFSRIDVPNAVVLNSEHPASNIIKPWVERLDEVRFAESDADDQLIVRIPFTGSVKLRSILIKSGPGAQTPAKLSVFVNEDGLDFEDVASQTPAQDFDVAQSRDVGEYTVKASKFSNVRSLTLFFPASQGDDTTRVYYLGFLGEWSELKNQTVLAVYEAQANLADHEKIQGTDGSIFRPGM